MVRVNDSEMSGERIVPAERLLLRTQRAVDLLLPGVVDRILVPREIVRAREDGVAWLAR